jgi:hypothetical protein
MNRKSFFKKSLGLGLMPVVLNSEKEDANRIKKDFAIAWKRSMDYTLQVFEQMPDTRLDFRYEKEAFTFRGQFVHCLNFSSGQLASRFGVPDIFENPKNWNKISKTEMNEEIKQFYVWVDKLAKEVPAKKLLAMDEYVGEALPLWKILYAIENHIIHHRGQAVCYLRLCGVIPEGYYGW